MVPRVTFGVIVLNGEPFTRYCLRAVYPFAHEIIVVEGASPGGAGIAGADGHSSDGTLEVLREFKAREDAGDKVTIVTAEDEGHPDGFWPGEKLEQSRAYARRATGDYLWQVDIDEFYRDRDMRALMRVLQGAPGVTAMSFKMLTFWGGLRYVADGWRLRRGGDTYHRLFKWGPGYEYVKHRQPTVLDDQGRDTRGVKWWDARATSRLGVRLFHYSLLLPLQVREKGEYYRHAAHSHRVAADWERWMQESYFTLRKPYRVHNLYHHHSWLTRYKGDHPEQVLCMMRDIRSGVVAAELRPADDVERILDSWWYPIGRRGLIIGDYVSRAAYGVRHPRSSIRRRVAGVRVRRVR